MPKRKIDFETVRKIGLTLSDVESGMMYGTPALKLHGRLLACVAINKSAEPESLVVRTDFEARTAMLSEESETYYVTDHYLNHPVVLVRLSRIRIDQIGDLLRSGYRLIIAHEQQKPPRRRKTQQQRGG